jgi:hypothetical protein
MTPRRMVAMLALGVALTGCASAGPVATTTDVPATTEVPTSAPPATPTARPSTGSPSGGPIQAIVANRSELPDSIVYQIAIASATKPMDQADAEARVAAIGLATGLGTPSAVWKDQVGGLWRAMWPGSIQGVPVDGSIADLELYPDGTVRSLIQTTGPLAPRPAKTLTKNQAIAASQSARRPDEATLVWSYVGSEDATTLRLEWRLTWTNEQPDGAQWPCSEWLDAGTGTVLQTACVS